MKGMNTVVAMALALVCGVAVCDDGSSAFVKVRFDHDIHAQLPRNWTYLDRNIAQQLNTSSEVLVRERGLAAAQGDNEVLVAANSVDTQGNTLASLRISARSAETPTQAQMRELLKESPSAVEALLRPSAEATVKMMAGMAGTRSYAVRALRVDGTGNLVCTLSSFEGDVGRGVFVFDTWMCPIGSRNIKLSTSYRKSLERLYQPTLSYIRKNLRAGAQ